MRLHRFYVAQPLGEDVVIDNDSHVSQWTKVFRYTKGNFVILFNGDGHDYCYSIETISKKTASLVRISTSPSYIPEHRIVLCMSLIKKDAFELVVEKATELGISSIIPIVTSRSEKKNLSFDRLTKIMQEASEQCGRGDVPVMAPITPLKEALEQLPKNAVPVTLTFDAKPLSEARTMLKTKDLYLFIGPEGGFGEEDLSILRSHSSKECSLGQTVLRAETAAIAAISVLVI